MKRSRFAPYALAVLVFNVFIILWGAVVRATGSGAGCGSHWPECDGEVIPLSMTTEKAIEFTHRATSGLAMLAIFGMYIWARRLSKQSAATNTGTDAYPRSGPMVSMDARIAAARATFFGIVECLIGAALVLFGWVDKDTSVGRAIAMSLHHVNTTILVMFLALTVWHAYGGPPTRPRGHGPISGVLGIGAISLVLVVVSGALSALGTTLFPARSTAQVLGDAMAPAAHFLQQLRIAHPFVSVSATLFLILALAFIRRLRPTETIVKLVNIETGLLVAQVLHGGLNILMKAPIWMQLMHLLISNAVVIGFVFLSAAALSKEHVVEAPEAPNEPAAAPMSFRETINAYVTLTKPRVISLLLFTTVVAMLIAQQGWPGGWLMLWVTIGGYLAAGAANAINMVIDSDIDGRMKRTASRPTVTHSIPTRNALIFGLTLAAISFVMLTLAANLLTACLALAGLLFYVFVYTLLLKRRTWQNIVIGGAAGAFPPLVGWAAVTGELSPLAWFLFALIFFWTPVHFWALALMIKDEYANVGVPMLPVVRGDRATVIQITAYAILTALVSAIPLVMGQLGMVYFVLGTLLNGLLVLRSVRLMQKPERPQALGLFKYSMAYLALVFVVIAVDRISQSPRPVVPFLTVVQSSDFSSPSPR